MSKYTTEVRFIVENACGKVESEGYNSVNELLTQACPLVFDFDYPIFDENYRRVLERKILKHYYTREIGLETVGLWKLFLDRKLNEIMPYYNKLYLSELIEINPLYTDKLKKKGNNKRNEKKSASDIRTESERNVGTQDSIRNSNVASERNDNSISVSENEQNSNGIANVSNNVKNKGTTTESGSNISTNENVNKFSDTPSGALNGVLSDNYLTTATQDKGKEISNNDNSTNIESENVSNNVSSESSNSKNNNKSNITNNSNNETKSVDSNSSNNENKKDLTGTNIMEHDINDTLDYIENITGHSGISESKLIMEYRKTFLNIDMQIIDELSDLFMNLW